MIQTFLACILLLLDRRQRSGARRPQEASMPTDNFTILVLSLVAGCLPALIVLAAALRLRGILGRRLQRLEDALRVYNTANAELGRQLREMEEQFRVPAPRSAAARAMEPTRAATRLPETSRPAEPVRGSATATARRPAAAAAGESEFSDAELKLARLLKSRLPAMRAG
jgi:hypothetical protein